MRADPGNVMTAGKSSALVSRTGSGSYGIRDQQGADPDGVGLRLLGPGALQGADLVTRLGPVRPSATTSTWCTTDPDCLVPRTDLAANRPN